MGVKIAVILSTYNAPQRLEPTLIGYAAQKPRNFEVIIADDGSSETTRELIQDMARVCQMPIKHVWHEDNGFRKCRIMNQAVLATNADYLIFSDGDCIPRHDFVAVHAARARPGRFLSGGYLKLPAETSARVDRQAIEAGWVTDPDWLKKNGMRRSHKLAKLSASGWKAELMNWLTPTRASWNGHNASCWRSDALRVNGFDERMTYWAEDREFGERLENAGIRGVQIRWSAICVHLHHDRPYRTDAGRTKNQQIRDVTKEARAVWTLDGIFKTPHLPQAAETQGVAADILLREYQPG